MAGEEVVARVRERKRKVLLLLLLLVVDDSLLLVMKDEYEEELELEILFVWDNGNGLWREGWAGREGGVTPAAI